MLHKTPSCGLIFALIVVAACRVDCIPACPIEAKEEMQLATLRFHGPQTSSHEALRNVLLDLVPAICCQASAAEFGRGGCLCRPALAAALINPLTWHPQLLESGATHPAVTLAAQHSSRTGRRCAVAARCSTERTGAPRPSSCGVALSVEMAQDSAGEEASGPILRIYADATNAAGRKLVAGRVRLGGGLSGRGTTCQPHCFCESVDSARSRAARVRRRLCLRGEGRWVVYSDPRDEVGAPSHRHADMQIGVDIASFDSSLADLSYDLAHPHEWLVFAFCEARREGSAA
jgi:hypothetical protein